MVGNIQDICCIKCSKYLFTEMDTENGYKRENDKEDYSYDEIKDEFVCNECFRSSVSSRIKEDKIWD